MDLLHRIQAFASPSLAADVDPFCLGVDAWPWLAAAVLPLLDPFVHGRDVLAAAVPGELAALAALHLVAHLLRLLFFQFRCSNRTVFFRFWSGGFAAVPSVFAGFSAYIASCSAGSL